MICLTSGRSRRANSGSQTFDACVGGVVVESGPGLCPTRVSGTPPEALQATRGGADHPLLSARASAAACRTADRVCWSSSLESFRTSAEPMPPMKSQCRQSPST